MKKNAVKGSLGAIALASAMTMSMGTPVFALQRDNVYSTEIGGEKTTTFDKYLVMDKQAEVPNASFTYAVTAGTAKAYDVAGKKFAVLAGVDADKVTMAGVGTKTANTITYKQGDATLNDANALVKDYDNATEKYAKKTATLDFSACRFTEPGIYRYIVTESGTNQAVTNDADATRVVDVYVNDASDNAEDRTVSIDYKLKIAGYVLHSNADDAPDVSLGENNGSAGSYVATKSQGFTNSYDTSDIFIAKHVSGNQASRDKYFEFTVKITDAVPGTVYDVDLSDADATTKTNAATITANEGKTNPATLTVGADGTVTQKFYLAHNQSIVIQGVAKDSKYKVTENAEDYKSTPFDAIGADADNRVSEGSADATSGTVASKDIYTGYVNTRDGVIPTGVIMTVAPFAAVTLLGGAGAVTMVMKKKKSEEE